MNITQRKHIISRLSGLRSARVNEYETALEREYDKKRPGPTTVGKLIAGITDGTIKKLPGVKLNEIVDWRFNEITDIFDVELDDDAFPDELYDKVRKFRNKLLAETDRIEDELILGDSDDALKAIADFSKFATKQK